jgi:hypothetical protein
MHAHEHGSRSEQTGCDHAAPAGGEQQAPARGPVQRRARPGAIQRFGEPLPGGAAVMGVENPRPDAVIAKIQETQRAMWGPGSTQLLQKTDIEDQIQVALRTGQFSTLPRAEYVDDVGVNQKWTIRVRFATLGPDIPTGGAHDSTFSGGPTGTGNVATQDTRTRMLGGQAGGQASISPPSSQGGPGGNLNAQVQGSETNAHQRGRGASIEETSQVEAPATSQTFRRIIVAEITVHRESPDVEGPMDLLGPTALPTIVGGAIADTVAQTSDQMLGTHFSERTATVPFCGFVEFMRTTGRQ